MLLLLLSAQNVISLPLPSEPSLISQVERNTETLSDFVPHALGSGISPLYSMN